MSVGTVTFEADTATWAVKLERFDSGIKNQVKALGAKFDWNRKVWRFDEAAGIRVLGQLRELGFDCPEAPSPSEEDSAPQGASEASDADALAGRTWSVRQLNQAVRGVLEGSFRTPIWLVGEVDGYNRNRNRQHAYFELVERDVTDRASARVPVVLFSSAKERIEAACRRAGLELADGMQVRVRARVTLYVPRGAYQLLIEDIDVSYTEGELALRREKILRQLRADGVLERNRSLPTPRLPLRVALVTSPTSDAYHDFVDTLAQSALGFDVAVFGVRVGGDDLQRTVRAALQTIREHPDRFDVCVITRGGGSRVELSAWDRLPIARDVATLPVKVVVAIGHHQDRSVLDEVATSVKTPTAAASYLVDACLREVGHLLALRQQLVDVANEQLRAQRVLLRSTATGLHNAVRHALTGASVQLDRVPVSLERAIRRRIMVENERVDRASRALPRTVEGRLEAASGVLRRAARTLVLGTERRRSAASRDLHALERRLARSAGGATRAAVGQLDSLAAQVRLVDPRRVLERGFALVRDESGRVVRSVASTDVDAAMDIELADGHVHVRVTETEPGEPR